MIPLRDDIPSRTVPVVNYLLIAANVMVFLYELSLGRNVGPFLYEYGVVPARILLFSRDPNITVASIVIPLFTSMFLHGGWLHLVGNVWYLYIFGDNVEDRLGHLRYLAFYLVCGLVAGLVQMAFSLSSPLPSIGASGAIAGVLAAYLVLYPRARILIFVFLFLIEIPAVVVLCFWIVVQLFNGVATIGASPSTMGGVAWWAHIGGFIIGLLVALKAKRNDIRSAGHF